LTLVRTCPECATTEHVVEGLIRAWNAGSATEFAGYFAENADLVNIHGMHLRGRQAIAGLYDMLFRSVFVKSALQALVASRRKLRADVELIHVKVHGNLRLRKVEAQIVIVTLVLTQHGNRWVVASMHNTLVSEARS
jgi:uncharacterized protein (TIGR02246 family)